MFCKKLKCNLNWLPFLRHTNRSICCAVHNAPDNLISNTFYNISDETSRNSITLIFSLIFCIRFVGRWLAAISKEILNIRVRKHTKWFVFSEVGLGQKKKKTIPTIAACAKRQIESNKPIPTHVSVPDLYSCELDLSILYENRWWKLAAECRLHINSAHVCKFTNLGQSFTFSEEKRKKKYFFIWIVVGMHFFFFAEHKWCVFHVKTRISGASNHEIFSTMQIYCS